MLLLVLPTELLREAIDGARQLGAGATRGLGSFTTGVRYVKMV